MHLAWQHKWPTCQQALREQSLHGLAFLLLGLCASWVCSPADAKVEQVEILSREAFARDTEFGSTGPYEKVRGRA